MTRFPFGSLAGSRCPQLGGTLSLDDYHNLIALLLRLANRFSEAQIAGSLYVHSMEAISLRAYPPNRWCRNFLGD
jgi:hypothetical protein